MKLIKSKHAWVVATIVLAIGYVVSCTKSDQPLNLPQVNTSTDLVSIKTTTPPSMDGVIDASWNSATKLSVMPTVPDPGNNLFTGYIGQKYPVTLRSMYDDNKIYFLAEVTDATKSVNVSPWYFDPALNVAGKTGWVKEPSSRTFDANGAMLREGMGEDKFAMLWNVDNSTPKFLTQTCYASCHIFTPYVDYSNPAIPVAKAATSGNHYTNGASEKIDMWWGKLGFMSKDASLRQMDDNYQDWAGGPAVTSLVGGNGNGRHVDGISVSGASATWPYAPTYTTSPNQGEISNSQNLKLDGTGASVAVPIWVMPNAAAAGFILVADTISGTAKKVVAVSSTGILTLSDNSTIDPAASTDYQRGSAGTVAAKSIPSFIAAPLIGGRADITSAAVYTGSGWIIEFSRALKTNDLLKQDIDFTNQKNLTTGQLQDQVFGVAFWNQSNNQHGIQPNLTLKFKN